MKNFHALNIKQSLFELSSSKNGLTTEEAEERKVKFFKNEKKGNFVTKFFEQFADFMIIILLIASAVSITIGIVQQAKGEIVDGSLILVIVLMNAIFGVIQENKAEKSIEALSKLTVQEIAVLRDGEIKKLKIEKLVVGDVIILEAGVILPADVRIIESHSLQIDEASLTGESHVIEKESGIVCKEDAPLGERKNMAYKGTYIAFGRGLGLVTALEEDTELGKIAKVISETTKETTPLQKSIKNVGKILTFVVLGVAVVTFIIEITISPLNYMEAFLTAVAISVAAIPESMPAVITIIMSLGIARLAKQKAIVKRMHSVETLGCCDVICSDKTGTITENKMTVVSSYCNFLVQEKKLSKTEESILLLKCSLLCNDTQESKEKILGDPTEIALTEYGKKNKIIKKDIDTENERIDEIPFDSVRKLMSVLTMQKENTKTMWTKGAVDKLIDRCDRIVVNGKVREITDIDKKEIIEANTKMSGKALRVLAFAYKDINSADEFKEKDLIFIGLMGMIDPPRKEILEAVKKCRKAGMRPVMITGDHSETAYAIAKEIGLVQKESQVITGQELSKLNDKELFDKIENYSVFARVSPQDKVRIVDTLKKRGHVVAMTGDGVNDAPSLKKANIGIGMGITGTDVSKEVSDIIVSDDNFATIVVAVEEGRKIYKNIQKTVKFLFSANLAELLSLFVTTLIFPAFVFLLPVQILFVNLITDSLPAIALGVENPESSLMEEKPRDPKKSLFADGVGISIIVLGIFQTLFVVLTYFIGIKFFSPEIATTMAFYTLNIIQMFYLISVRTKANIFKSKPHKNKLLLLALGFCFGLIALFAFTPIRSLLRLEMLGWVHWAIIFGFSVLMLIVSEVYKLIEKLIIKNKKAR